jgi:hypothetical protein
MAEIPTVTLAGKQYPVPILVARQLRIVVPAIMRLGVLAKDPTKLTTAHYDDMISILFWGAIWPNDRKANESFLMDLPLSFQEMQDALTVIRGQTGLFVAAPPEGAPPGEASP